MHGTRIMGWAVADVFGTDEGIHSRREAFRLDVLKCNR
jgi:hypothetical protein